MPRVCDELACDTHPLQCRGFKLDMQETSATEVCVSIFSFFLREGGVRLGLVVQGEGGRLGLVLVVICLRLYTSPSVPGVRARHARNKRH